MPSSHPLGILPEGHILLDGGDMSLRNAGLGSLHGLSDALLLDILGHLDAQALSSFSCASKACYCFCTTEDLWKALVLEEFEGNFVWDTKKRSWRAAYAASRVAAATRRAIAAESSKLPPADQANSSKKRGPGDHEQPQQEDCSKRRRRGGKQVEGGQNCGWEKAPAHGSAGVPESCVDGTMDGCIKAASKRGEKGGRTRASKSSDGGKEEEKEEQARVGGLRVHGFYSDLLYQPWHCATVELQPEWLEVSNVDRKRNLSPAVFREQYELKNMPVVIVDGAAKWPALTKWSMQYLEQAFAGKPTIAGNLPMPFTTYSAYAHNTIDEMPLYLFDKEFADTAPQLASDFTVPSVFTEDLFGVLGSSRPDYRWLIVGPARSGSSFHVDPNCTSAWNAVVRGSKKWILFPPSAIPPGVHPSPDGADVATPVSVIEWFLNFYAAAREAKVPPWECVVRAGEVIFVPRGWWHACLNLETMTIAVTQNYVSSANVCDVLRFIRPGRSDLVSGCALDQRTHLYDRFFTALRQQRPDMVRVVEQQEEARRAQRAQESKLLSLFSSKGGNGVLKGKEQQNIPEEQEQAAAGSLAKPGGTSDGFCFHFAIKQ